MMEPKLSALTSLGRRQFSPKMCECPTISDIFFGRMRTAKGAESKTPPVSRSSTPKSNSAELLAIFLLLLRQKHFLKVLSNNAILCLKDFLMDRKTKTMKCAMTIAGSDSGGGAGIQADMLSIAANGVYACTAVAAITAQNPERVSGILAVPPEILRAQMEAIDSFYKPEAAKTGMLYTAEIVDCVADFFESRKSIKLVVDPVIISTSGAKLLSDDAVIALKKRLIPIAEVVTPNLDEACLILDTDKITDIEAAAQKLVEKLGSNVLLKGGHLAGDNLCDTLALKDGSIRTFTSKRVKTTNTHGSGCTLSAAIAANLAKGLQLNDAVSLARTYLLAAIKNPLNVGGEKFINHFAKP